MRLFRHGHAHGGLGRRFVRPPHHEHGLHEHRHGRGGRLARFLEHGDLRLLVLHLIQEKPRHGYEIIKAIEDLAAGAYAPSPGVIYPTLALLEELGQVQSTEEGNRKRFAITPEGEAALAEHREAVERLVAKIAAAQPREVPPPIIRAMENLKTAMRLKFGTPERAPDLARKVADLLDQTARQIEEL